MRYVTTKCRNCGYKTRNHESGVPRVQLGTPIFKCPKCGHLILDPIQTEYEFMTDSERTSFSSNSMIQKNYFGSALFIIFGIVLFIAGIVLGGGYIAIAILGGLGCIGVGIFDIIRGKKMANNEEIEQAIYESLQRTANTEYVAYIKNVYNENGIKKIYTPFVGRNNFIELYKKFEARESYKESMNEFNQFLEMIGDESIHVEKHKEIWT